MTKTILVIRHHTSHVGLGLLEEVTNDLGFGLKELFLNEGDVLPTDLTPYAAVYIMGGKQSVADAANYPWMLDELLWLNNILTQPNRPPILGVCLGCQLLAKTYGAEVYKGKEGVEVGFKKIGFVTKDDPYLKPTLCGQQVFQWHQDTFDLPESAQLIATGLTYKNQVIKFADQVYGFQFHPDVCERRIENWYKEPQGQEWKSILPPLNEVLLSYQSHKPIMRLFLKDFLTKYLESKVA